MEVQAIKRMAKVEFDKYKANIKNAKKYHVSKDGRPRICHAEINCPLGANNPHFKTEQESQIFADDINNIDFLDKKIEEKKEHWLYSQLVKDSMSFEEKQDLVKFITSQEFLKDGLENKLRQKLGLIPLPSLKSKPKKIDFKDYGEFGSSTNYKTRKAVEQRDDEIRLWEETYNLAFKEKKGFGAEIKSFSDFSNWLIKREDGVIYEPNNIPENRKEELTEVIKKMFPENQFYKKKNKKLPVKMICESESSIIVLGNDNNYSDIYIYSKKSGKISAMEVKSLDPHAQISNLNLEFKDGKLIFDNNDEKISAGIARELEKYNPIDNLEHNYKLDIPQREAIRYLILKYREQNVDRIQFHLPGAIGVETIRFRCSYDMSLIEEDIQEFIDNDIEVKLLIRNNLDDISRNVTEDDIADFAKHYDFLRKKDRVPLDITNPVVVFNDYEYSTKEHTSTCKMIHPTKTEVSTGYFDTRKLTLEERMQGAKGEIRIGEFVLKDYEIYPNVGYDLRKFKRVLPVLTGDISYRNKLKKEEDKIRKSENFLKDVYKNYNDYIERKEKIESNCIIW